MVVLRETTRAKSELLQKVVSAEKHMLGDEA